MLRTNILEGQMPYNKDKPDFWDKTPETYAETPEYPDGVYLKADGKPDPRKGKLSNRQRTFAELVKAPAPSCFHLFRGSQAIDLAQKPMSEVRGPRFSGLGEVWDALRLEAVDHFAKFAKSG
jgi:hypothetical protein